MAAFRINRGGAVMVGAVVLTGIASMSGHVAAGVLLGALAVVCLLLHECGHMLAARTLDVKVIEIGLCLRGSYIRREPTPVPLDDAAIAMSGPMVNALIAATLWTMPGVGHWLAIYNLVLAVSNLLPLPGSDGRRILCAWNRAAVEPRIPAALPKEK